MDDANKNNSRTNLNHSTHQPMMAGYPVAHSVVVNPEITDTLSDDEDIYFETAELVADVSISQKEVISPIRKATTTTHSRRRSQTKGSSQLHKQDVERMLGEREGGNAAVLRRIVKKKKQYNDRFSHVQKSLQTAVIREDTAPSDEDDDDDVVQRTKSPPPRHRYKSHEVGRLSPIKLKTAWSVKPSSIRVYQPPPPLPTSAPTTKNTDKSKLSATKQKKKDSVSDAVEASTLFNFSKLKLQVAVAEKHSKKQRVVAKLEDRVQDVEMHKQLWEQYQKIQSVVIGCVEKDHNENPHAPPNNTTMQTPEKKKAKDVTTVEYDLEVNEQNFSQKGSPQKSKRGASQQGTSQCSVTSKNSRSSLGRKSSSFKQQQKQSSQEECPSEHFSSTDSFDLKQSSTWYFDFLEEFQNVAPTTVTVGSNGSQADLSLLSASSMEAQRRLYAEKRRQRKQKKKAVVSGAADNNHSARNGTVELGMVELDMARDTPMTRNGRNQRRRISANGTQQDYGPTTTTTGRPGSSQQLRAAPGNDQLQMANEVLKSRARTLTDLEVTFLTPESFDKNAQGDNDNESMVSDLDDTISAVSQFSSRRHSTSNEYGVKRRPRKRVGRRVGGDDGADQSSVSTEDEGYVQHHETSVLYDHQTVVQRRLDIEARLMALFLMDDDDGIPVRGIASQQKQPDKFDGKHGTKIVPALVQDDDYSLPAVVTPNEDACTSRRQRTRDLPGTEYYLKLKLDEFPGSPTPLVTPVPASHEETPYENVAKLADSSAFHNAHASASDYVNYGISHVQSLSSQLNVNAITIGKGLEGSAPLVIQGSCVMSSEPPLGRELDSALPEPVEISALSSVHGVDNSGHVVDSSEPHKKRSVHGRNLGAKGFNADFVEWCNPMLRLRSGVRNSAVGHNSCSQSPRAMNESFESTESRGAMPFSLPFLEDKKSIRKILGLNKDVVDGADNDSMVANQSTDSESQYTGYSDDEPHGRSGKPFELKKQTALGEGFEDDSMIANGGGDTDSRVGEFRSDMDPRVNVIYDDSHRRNGAKDRVVQERVAMLGDTRDTLHLADQVEARVRDLLERYRTVIPDRPNRVIESPATRQGS